jgi:hypothetical protein
MKRIYYRLNWKDYIKTSGNSSKENKDSLYEFLYNEVKSASSKNLKELCVAADNYTRTMILVPNDEYIELLQECILYFQNKEDYELCIKIRDTIERVKKKKLKKRKPKSEEEHKLILVKLNPVSE